MLTGRHDEAKRRLADAAQRATDDFGSDSYESLEIKAFAALNSAIETNAANDLLASESALLRLFDRFGSTLEKQKNQMAREQRLALFVEKFLKLASEVGDTLPPGRTFRIAQAGQGGSVQAALASSALRAGVSNPFIARFVAQVPGHFEPTRRNRPNLRDAGKPCLREAGIAEHFCIGQGNPTS